MNYKLLLIALLYNIHYVFASKGNILDQKHNGDINSCPDTIAPSPAYKMTNGYYIGYAYNDCSANNIYICKSYEYRYGTPFCIPVAGCSAPCIPTFYQCYNYEGKTYTFMDLDGNPFDGKCNKLIKAVFNAHDSKCYFSPYGNTPIPGSNFSIRYQYTNANNDGVTPRTVNGRCITYNGWCPCERYYEIQQPKPQPQTKPSGKCPYGTTTNDRCGPDNGNKCCHTGYCCSKYGYCGKSNDHCKKSKGCQSNFGKCIN